MKYKNVTITRKKMKNLILKEEYGQIKMSAPTYATDTQIKQFIDKNIDWIQKHSHKTKITLWGKPYTPKNNENLDKLYKKETQKETEKILKECTQTVGKTPNTIKYRKMKNWGNCKKNGTITLNTRLAAHHKEALKMTLIHELCHLKEFGHTKKFWKLMDQYYPNHKEIKEKLNKREI